MTSRAATIAFQGIEAVPVDVQAQFLSGMVAFNVVGLVHGNIRAEELGQLPQILGDVLQDGDLLLVMGAGDIGAVANELAVSGLQLEHRA